MKRKKLTYFFKQIKYYFNSLFDLFFPPDLTEDDVDDFTKNWYAQNLGV